MTTPKPNLRGVIFFGAHPDDETVMTGGTLAMLHAAGVPVHIVCVTDGQGGESGGISEAEKSRAALARIRAEELRGAVAALGANSYTMLNYVDPLIGADEELYGFEADENTLIAQIAALIDERGADVVLTHGSDGEYGHPAHVQVHNVVKRAVQKMAENAENLSLYTICARVPGMADRIMNESDPAHVALDITPWVDAKHAAMLSHRTQHALFKRRRKLETVREAIRYTEGFHRVLPPVPDGGMPGDPFAGAILAAGGWVPDHTAETGEIDEIE